MVKYKNVLRLKVYKKHKVSTVLTTVFNGRNGAKSYKYSVIKCNGPKHDRIQLNKIMY